VRMQGADELALTKLDVLSYLERIPVCVRYRVHGRLTNRFPQGEELEAAEPVYEYLPGWKTDITGCRSFDELPKEAREYILYLEHAVGAPIRYVSVGAGRDEYFVR